MDQVYCPFSLLTSPKRVNSKLVRWPGIIPGHLASLMMFCTVNWDYRQVMLVSTLPPADINYQRKLSLQQRDGVKYKSNGQRVGAMVAYTSV